MKTIEKQTMMSATISMAIFVALAASAIAQTVPREEISPMLDEVFMTPAERPDYVIGEHTQPISYLGLRDTYDEGDRIAVRLFDDVRVTARVTIVSEIDDGIFEITGEFRDDPISMFLLSYWADGAIGTIHTEGRMFDVLPVDGGRVRITEYDQGRFPADRVLEEPDADPPAPGGKRPVIDSAPNSPDTASPPLITILLVVPRPEYENYCRTGRIHAVARNLEQQIDWVWAGAAYSKIIVRCLPYETQGHKLIEYVDDGGCWQDYEDDNPGETLDADYDWLSRSPVIKEQRDLVRADLVVMVVNDYYWCGVAMPNDAEISPNDAGNAHAVVAFDCMRGKFTLQHELGHLLGMKHDRNTTDPVTAAGCNYGYICMRGKNVAGRTVMAYYGSCIFQGGTHAACRSRYPMHSTPDPRVYRAGQGGMVCGQPCTNEPSGPEFGPADNYQQLQNVARTVAEFRR